MSLYEDIKWYLENTDNANRIYKLEESEKETLEEVKKYLKEDHGYLDIVLDFSDYSRMQKLINSIPEEYEKSMMSSFIARQYMLYKIMRATDLKAPYYLLDDFEDKLFSDDFAKFLTIESPSYFNDIEEDVIEKGQETENGIARMHIFLDDVTDGYLQANINDLFALRSQVEIIAYTTKPLITRALSGGGLIEETHDYKLYTLESNEKVYKKEK